jgi:hypothetical protein
MAYEEFRQRILELQSYHGMFNVEFLDRGRFKQFADNLYSNLDPYLEVCITGYFSETIREALERILRKSPRPHVRLICPELNPMSKRDSKNLQVLKRLALAGADIKINSRLHARLLVAYQRSALETKGEWRGLLVIGSFDFNTECIAQERLDAGLKTSHPDLVKSTAQFFDRIWNEPESELLDKK